ncbi:hypothetical protein FQR65_LT06842 [Abscondita terminalis]|nr:hypothetical protein FQR65_LT06842 [Abscondita terminalis]
MDETVDIPDELYDKHALQCLEKTKIDKKDVENMLDEDLHISVKTEHVRKFFECMTESKIAIKEDGQINRDVMYRDTVNVLLPMMKIKGDLNEIANKILDECMSVTGDDQVFSIEVPDKLIDNPTSECMKKANLEKKDIEKLFDENFHMSSNNANLKEFFECSLNAKGGLTEDGQVVRDVLYNDVINILLPMINKKGDLNEIANKMVDECINVTDDDFVKRFVDMHNCLVDAANKY